MEKKELQKKHSVGLTTKQQVQPVDQLTDIMDQLNITADSEAKKIFENESVFLSCKVQKYNKYDWKQERIFVVTEKHIFSLKSKRLRRKVPIHLLAGLTVSKDPNSKELVIHILGEHDFRLKSERRTGIMNAIKIFYLSMVKENIPIYGVRQKTLSEYTTKEKDVQKGITRVPLDLARLSEEDLVNLDQFRTGSSGSGSNSGSYEKESLQRQQSMGGVPMVEIITDDFENNINHRGRAYMASRNSVSITEDSDDVLGDSKEKSESLFCRSSECEKVNLEDFELINVIGRGNFGKVYLVYLPQININPFIFKGLQMENQIIKFCFGFGQVIILLLNVNIFLKLQFHFYIYQQVDLQFRSIGIKVKFDISVSNKRNLKKFFSSSKHFKQELDIQNQKNFHDLFCRF